LKFEKLFLYLIVSLLFLQGTDAAIDESDSLLARVNSAEMRGDSIAMLSALSDLANFYDDSEKFDTAAFYFNRAIRIADSISEKASLADMQIRLGNIHLIWGGYNRALELYLSSLLISNEINDSAGISKSLNNIGVIYSDWGELETSRRYYQRSLEVDSLLGNFEGQSKTLNNIAILFDELGNKERALRYYYRALGLAALIEDHYMIAVANSNIGGYYLELEDYEQAADFYFRTLKEYKLARSVIGQAETYILIGDLYKAKEEYSAALDYYRQGLEIVEPRKVNWALMNVYESMHEVYIEQGNYKLAYTYYAQLHDLQDSIFSVESSSHLSFLSNTYEIQQKDQDLELQQSRMNEQKSRIKRQLIAMISLVVLIVIIAIFTTTLIRQYRLRMKAWNQLLSQHEEILKNRQELILAKEMAEESDRLKTTFLVNVSHELRTPMNGIMGFTDLLQREKGHGEQSKLYLSYIASSSRQLMKVLNDILDISSIETGQLKLEPENCKPSTVFSDILEYFEKEKTNSNKEELILNYIPPPDTDLHHCKIDKKRLGQILFNLMNNALSFTREGMIDFGYEIHEQKMIKIFVRDTGIGIERSNFDLIFERFRQIDDSTTRQHGGSGLGLAICKELVKLMHGRIYVKSQIGKGSTFFVEIPYIPANLT